MLYRRLYICVEGTDDELFFNKVIKTRFESTYDDIKVVRYAQKSLKKRKSFLLGIRALEGADIFWVCDNDRAPCVTARKDSVRGRLPAIADNPIVVVVTEIESWYLAGIGADESHALGIKDIPNTNTITKETFRDLRPSRVKTNREFMLALLDHFLIETAQNKNQSFRYFYQKHLSQNVLKA